GVDPGRHQDLRRLYSLGPELVRVEGLGQGMQVDDAVERVVVFLEGNPVPQRAHVVAQVDLTGGLDARQHACHIRGWYAVAAERPGRLQFVPYEVQTAVFEGPFDLLLHLITSEQVDVYEVSLSRIVDGYLTELERMDHLDLDVATEFLLIAATLVELKTRRLLPGPDSTDLDEELLLFEERDLLLARLLECKTFKDAATELERLLRAASHSHPRTAGLEERFLDVAPDILAGVTPTDLAQALVRAATPKPVPRIDLDHVAPIRASVRDAL